jgi:transcriptional regulator with GAF, ATPase, and Fis domain
VASSGKYAGAAAQPGAPKPGAPEPGVDDGVFEGIVGRSAAMRELFALVDRVAASNAPVLVRGESGTGKEMVARAIHRRSPRSKRRLLAVNCGALSESTLESELFGHVKGAFTGAFNARIGLFEAASGGTLFLDEIAELSPSSQVKLLRTLQEGEVRPIGSNESRPTDVRVVCATHRDLEQWVSEGRFRQDLYYRINVVSVVLPPLRDRAEDIPLLVRHFLDKHGSALGVSEQAHAWLAAQSWPGNARELENSILRATLVARGVVLRESDFVGAKERAPRPAGSLPPLSTARTAFERAYVDAVLQRAQGNLSTAARIAGMDRSNFRRLMRRYAE